MSRRVLLLGSTGSIGTQTLDVIRTLNKESDSFEVCGLAAGSNASLLAQQIAEFNPRFAALQNESALSNLSSALENSECKLLAGDEGILELISKTQPDLVVNAIVGAAGLKPTLAALELGIDIAQANKESLVIGGELVQTALAKSKSKIIPVDSEHNSIFQLLEGRSHDSVSKVIITASGGALREHPLEDFEHVTREEVLKHPNWDMGARITVDSATLVNKAFEVIEAKWLFDFAWEDTVAVIHPQSTIHGMVELSDGGLLAYMGPPDMRIPIQHALTYPASPSHRFEKIDWGSFKLQLKPINHERYPAFNVVIEAGKLGGTAPAAINAADEVAVDRFLEGQIKFPQIAQILSSVLDQHSVQNDPTLDDLIHTDQWARELASNL